MTSQSNIIPFRKPPKRDADGVLQVPPPTRIGGVYVFFDKPRARMRKKRWFIYIEYCDSSYETEEGPADWAAAMFLARVRARKFGFRVVDASKWNIGGSEDGRAGESEEERQ
jgi:hypothetical protein